MRRGELGGNPEFIIIYLPIMTYYDLIMTYNLFGRTSQLIKASRYMSDNLKYSTVVLFPKNVWNKLK